MKNPTGVGRGTGVATGVVLMTSKTITRTKGGTGNMNIYKELEHIEILRERIKENQNQVLDVYDPQNDMMRKLLVEMNDLLVEVDQVDKELAELMKQL
jgi:hypothetical protein